ncbi:hypothetical protein [Paenibacillus sp. FSL R5-0473]|uniref:hypothetical protein n=1 Tax=Paenibacillus sp. FSL R5-0473 TaxID=2921642 RepID=UPI0030F70665
MGNENIKYNKELEKMFKHNAKVFNSLKPLIEGIQKSTRDISKAMFPSQEALEQLSQRFKSLELNPNSFIDNINRACDQNTKFGWCISGHMTIRLYCEIGSSEDSQEEKDRLFVNEFETNNFYLYEKEKQSILLSSKHGWNTFYKECFFLIDHQKYQAVVPSLLSAIEHELSYEHTNDIGKGLIRRVRSSLERDGDTTTILYAISTSVLNLLNNMIFERYNFDEDRPPIINRNWVLHGRDTPSLWGKQDVYKLILLISALRMLNKRILNE